LSRERRYVAPALKTKQKQKREKDAEDEEAVNEGTTVIRKLVEMM